MQEHHSEISNLPLLPSIAPVIDGEEGQFCQMEEFPLQRELPIEHILDRPHYELVGLIVGS
jgi:hypothetical protein